MREVRSVSVTTQPQTQAGRKRRIKAVFSYYFFIVFALLEGKLIELNIMSMLVLRGASHVETGVYSDTLTPNHIR